MGNQNINGLKYCCRHKPNLKYDWSGKGHSVTCFKCGKTVEGYADSYEAIEAWNKKIKGAK